MIPLTEIDCATDRCERCEDSPFICHCMKVTKAALVEVIMTRGLTDLYEVRNATGAGDGCMACRRRLQGVLDEVAETASSRGGTSLTVVA